jgi:diguanylate cyclase (GGDEF)-like protein
MNNPSSLSADPFRSCQEQLRRLLPEAAEFAFVTPEGEIRWRSSDTLVLDEQLLGRVHARLASSCRRACIIDSAQRLALIPIFSGEQLIGALLAPVTPNEAEPTDRAVERIWRRLRPALDRLGRQLAPRGELHAQAIAQTDAITEATRDGTEDLGWLLVITSELQSSVDKTAALEQLLATAVDRMNASFGALTFPDKQSSLTYQSRVLDDTHSARAYAQAKPYLMSYMQARVAPLIANRAPESDSASRTCKIMAVPITRRIDKQVGAIAFCKPSSLPDFSRGELYLAQHIALIIQALLDSQNDPATGLLTRIAVEQEAAKIIASSDASELHAVIYVNVDHLHVVNETFGFNFGDQAIVRIASLLRPPHLPGNAVAGRVAGDRFIVFLPACDTARAQQWSQSLQSEVNKLSVGAPTQRITLSASCGIASVPNKADAFCRALAAAELACRTAKERGRQRSEVYLDIDDSMMRRKADISGVVRLRAALEKERLQVFAQRIVPLRDVARTSGVECLTRLVTEDGAILEPADFCSAASRYQLSRALDEWMIKHTLAAVQPHASMLFHGEIHVALNISEQSLHDDDFLRYLEDSVYRSDVAPGLISFEIGESVAVRDVARTRLVMRSLQNLGCSITFDDFGASPGSFGHLRNLRPDGLKIDGGIVRDVLGNADCEAAIRSISELAAECRVQCVAKHAESDAIVRKLRELGVSYTQGHSLHAAEPLTKVLESLCEEESQQLQQLYLEQSP